MAISQPPPPSAAGSPDQDKRPSIKIGVAALMLRRGHHPLEVANATDVPLALVELIAAEQHAEVPGRRRPTWAAAGAIDAMLEEPLLASGDRPITPAPSVQDIRPGGSRWAVWICCAAVLIILGNIGLAAAAEITHMPTLAMAAVILTPLLLTGLGLLVIGCTCAGRRF